MADMKLNQETVRIKWKQKIVRIIILILILFSCGKVSIMTVLTVNLSNYYRDACKIPGLVGTQTHEDTFGLHITPSTELVVWVGAGQMLMKLKFKGIRAMSHSRW